jgi:hypothetical protein
MPKFTDLFYYDAECGRLRNRGSQKRKHGSYTSWLDLSSGYYRLSFKGKHYLEHRVIYEMFNGPFVGDLDHIDRNKLNNRIDNLRLCTRPQNVVNSKVRSDNKSGYKGVVWHKASGKWQAQTMLKGKRLHLGLFNNPEDAALAYNKKMKELHGDFAVLNTMEA